MVFEKSEQLVNEITRNVLDAYYYGTQNYTGEIHEVNCVDNYYNVDITFMKHKIELSVSKNGMVETLALPYGKHGQTELIIMIQTTIDVMTFMLQGKM